MNITVVGPGALGCLFASMLAMAGNSVWVLDYKEERAAYLDTHGIVLRIDGKNIHVPIRATSVSECIGKTDLVLLCVKSQAVETTLRRLESLLSGETLVVAMQNGIGHHEALERAIQHFAIGITAQGGTLTGIGEVTHGGAGETVLGYLPTAFKSEKYLLASFATVLTDAGLPTTVTDDIRGPVWDKLVVNVGINALTAIYDCCNGALLEDSFLAQQQKAAVKEVARVATEKGIVLSGNPLENTRRVCRATRSNISSMLQDVRKGRRTEIHAINGAIVREGKRLGIPTPVNSELVRKIEAIELAGSIEINSIS